MSWKRHRTDRRCSTTTSRGRLLRGGVLVVLALLVLSTIPTGVIAQDSFEPNDSREEAARVETDTEIDAGLATNDYYDWYTFDVGSGDNVSVTFTSEAMSEGSDISLTLYDTNGDFVDLETVEAGETIDIGYILGQTGTAELSVFDTDPADYTFTVHTNGSQADPTATQSDELGADAEGTAVAPSSDLPPLEIDASNLATYTSVTGSYSIEFPGDWEVYPDTRSERTLFAPIERNGQLGVTVTETGREYSLKELTEVVNETSFDEMEAVEELGRRDVVLPSGQRATLIDSTYDNPNDGGGQLHSKYLFVPVGTVVYEVELVVANEDYDSGLDSVGNTIVESFTVGSTASETTVAATTTATETATATTTDTPTPAPTTTADTTEAGGSSSGDTEAESGGTAADGSETTGTFGPGFGLVGAVIALLAVALFAARRR